MTPANIATAAMKMTTILTGRFGDALIFAAHVHIGQLRKGTTVPYIAHEYPVNSRHVAQLTVRTFRKVYRINHRGVLKYKAFIRGGGQIRFSCLHIKREGT